MKSFRKRLIAAGALVTLAPSPLLACAACGSANPYASASPLTTGMNLGILTLLGVVLTVLTCVALFFAHVVRSEKSSLDNPDQPAPNNPTDV